MMITLYIYMKKNAIKGLVVLRSVKLVPKEAFLLSGMWTCFESLLSNEATGNWLL